jgi:hypothetical protein
MVSAWAWQPGVDHQHAVAADRYDDVRAGALDHVQVAANREGANLTALLCRSRRGNDRGGPDECDEYSGAHHLS